MKNGYWLAMDEYGVVYVYCDDMQFHPLFPLAGEIGAERPETIWADAPLDAIGAIVVPNQRKPRAYKFDGSECVTAECLPGWSIDNYYVANLPESFANSPRS